jgi:hypothetical protein
LTGCDFGARWKGFLFPFSGPHAELIFTTKNGFPAILDSGSAIRLHTGHWFESQSPGLGLFPSLATVGQIRKAHSELPFGCSFWCWGLAPITWDLGFAAGASAQTDRLAIGCIASTAMWKSATVAASGNADTPAFTADEIAIYRDFLLHYPEQPSEMIGMQEYTHGVAATP